MTAVRVNEPLTFNNSDELDRRLLDIRMAWLARKSETMQLACVDHAKGRVTVYAKVRTGQAA